MKTQELASHGHTATLIPVLSFAFVSLNTLSDKVKFTLQCLNILIYVLLLLYGFTCFPFVPVLAVPTRKTRWSYIYQSESRGGCEDVPGSRKKS